MEIIRRNKADVVLSGGADSKINPLSLLRFYILKLLANGWERPGEASRPFDKKRNGLVVGEGAGVVVLEKLSIARARGSKVYAELIGFGSSFSNKANQEESIKGKIQAMNSAIMDAGIRKEEIELISAHGISTQEDDFEEREAIQRLFGENAKKIPVLAPKSAMGYPGAASGILGLIAAVLAMNRSVIPANCNYTERDIGDELDYVAGTLRRKEINCAMINAFGIGGHNGVIIIRRVR
jgi:3-oxoacyl-[acyl-carrier-protein] synthase II